MLATRQNKSSRLCIQTCDITEVPTKGNPRRERICRAMLVFHSSPCVEAITFESLQWHTEKDKVLSILRDHIIEGKIPNVSKLSELQPFSKIFNELTITERGLLLRGEGIILPRDLLKRAIEIAHQGGHPG